jgi:hypothetical protein
MVEDGPNIPGREHARDTTSSRFTTISRRVLELRAGRMDFWDGCGNIRQLQVRRSEYGKGSYPIGERFTLLVGVA